MFVYKWLCVLLSLLRLRCNALNLPKTAVYLQDKIDVISIELPWFYWISVGQFK